MNKSKILKKLEGVLSAEDLKTFEESLDEMIDEKVNMLVEERTNYLDEKAEEYTKKEVQKRLDEEKETLIEEYDEKLKTLEEKIINNLDEFLDSEIISESIKDELVEKTAINETYKPIIDGIMDLFENKFVSLDTEGYKLVKEAKENVQSKIEELDEAIQEKISLKKENEDLKSAVLIAQKIEGMTPKEKERVVNFFEGKDYSDIEKGIDDFVEMVKEDAGDKKSNRSIDNDFENDDEYLGENTFNSDEENELDEDDDINAASSLL